MSNTTDDRMMPGTEGNVPARRATVVVILAVALASLVYRVVAVNHLEQTAALFIGIPTILAIVVVLGVTPRSATGVACKAVTVGLLISLIFLGEGILCVMMSAPLFYAVAVVIGSIIDWARRRERRARVLSSVALLALVPMSLEGIVDGVTFNRDEWVTETRVVQGSADDVAKAVLETPRFHRRLPLYLQAGFPWPTATRIERGSGRPRWIIRMRGGEMRLDGMEPRAGDLVLELEESGNRVARWRAVSDDSHMQHFLSWRESIVTWAAVDARTTRVTWTIRYRRGLDPAWYFGPWERYAARLAAGYLIDAVATP